MKVSNTCPKCQSQRFLITSEFVIPKHQSSIHVATVPAFTAGFGAPDEDTRREIAGNLERWTCAQCGFTEWYVGGLEHFDLSKMGGQVRYFDAAAPPTS